MEDQDRPLAWKEQRQRLKEWKWADIELGNFEDINFMYIVGWIIVAVLFAMPFIDVILDAILIHQMYDVRETLKYDVAHNLTQSFCSPNATSTKIVYNFKTTHNIFPCHIVLTSLLVMVIAYSVFALVSLLFSVYDLWYAYTIVKSDDVSDSFIDQVTYRVHAVRWYSHFCVFRAIEGEQSYTDQAVIFVYQNLRNGKQLIADVPHFIMALFFSVLLHQINTENLTGARTTATTILKIVLLVYRLGGLIACLIAYPFLRWRVAHARLQLYASFLIEKRLDLTLWGQKHKFSEDPTADVTVIATVTVSQEFTINSSPPQPPPSVPLLSDPSSPSPLPSDPSYPSPDPPNPFAPPYVPSPPVSPISPPYDPLGSQNANLPPGYSQRDLQYPPQN